jgi:hypothetical protein
MFVNASAAIADPLLHWVFSWRALSAGLAMRLSDFTTNRDEY